MVKQNMIHFTYFCNNTLQLPISVASNFIINEDNRIPWLSKNIYVNIPNKKNPKSWSIDEVNAIKLYKRYTNLPQEIKNTINNIAKNSYDVKIPLQDLVCEREPLAEEKRTYKYHNYVAWLDRYSKYMNDQDKLRDSVCFRNVFDFDNGRKMTDHIWANIVPKCFDGYKEIEPNQWVTFKALTSPYRKIHNGSSILSMRFKFIKYLKPVKMEELAIWKDEIKKKRAKS